MTSAIVLPPAPTWAQRALVSLYSAKTHADFDTAFDNFISKNARSFTLNGATLTRDQFKQQVQGERLLERSAVVKFNGVVGAPPLGQQASATQEFVGLFYDVTFVEGIVVMGAPQEHTGQSSLNIEVDTDTSIPLPPAGIRGDVERRRVFSLNQVLIDQPGAAPASSN